MTRINYEAEVRKVYPDAKCKRIKGWYAIYFNCDEILSILEYTPYDAWSDAYNRLIKEGKIKE